VRLIPIIILLIFCLPAVLFLLLVGKLFLRGKAESWEGVVVDKGHVIKDKYEQDEILNKKRKKQEHLYHIKVKIEEGKNKGEVHSIAVPAEMYEEIKVGDRLKKEKGALWPRKV